MLKLKQKNHFTVSFPRLFASKPMQLNPVAIADDDELSLAIENDAFERDNAWELTERPDVNELVKYWEFVTHDIRKDSKELSFSED